METKDKDEDDENELNPGDVGTVIQADIQAVHKTFTLRQMKHPFT